MNEQGTVIPFPPQIRRLMLATIATIPFLAGCTTTTVTTTKFCRVEAKNGYGTYKFQVANVGRWCGYPVDVNNPDDAGVMAVTTLPLHGQARIRRTGRSIWIEYRPNREFSGTDEFMVNMGYGMTYVRMIMDVIPREALQSSLDDRRTALAAPPG